MELDTVWAQIVWGSHVSTIKWGLLTQLGAWIIDFKFVKITEGTDLSLYQWEG